MGMVCILVAMLLLPPTNIVVLGEGKAIAEGIISSQDTNTNFIGSGSGSLRMDFNDGGKFESGGWTAVGVVTHDDFDDTPDIDWANQNGIYSGVRTDEDLWDRTASKGAWCCAAKERGGLSTFEYSSGWGQVSRSFNLRDYLGDIVDDPYFRFTTGFLNYDYKMRSDDFDNDNSEVCLHIYLSLNNGQDDHRLKDVWCCSPYYGCENPDIEENDYKQSYMESGETIAEFLNEHRSEDIMLKFRLYIGLYGRANCEDWFKFWLDDVYIFLEYEYGTPEPIFHLPFEGNLTDVIHQVDPFYQDKVNYTDDGIRGQALKVCKENCNTLVQYEEIRQGPNLNFNTAEGTIEFWVRPQWDIEKDMGPYAASFFVENKSWGGDPDSSTSLRIIAGGGALFTDLRYDLSNWKGTFQNIRWWNKEEWHHIAYTWEDTTANLYIDGMFFSSFNVKELTGQDYFYIGRHVGAPDRSFDIDELKIYKRALLDPEIKEHCIKLFPVEYYAKETVFYTTRIGQQVEVSIKNIAQETITGHFRCTANGSTRSKWIELQPKEIYTFKGAEAPLFPNVADPGEHYLDCYFGISPGPDVYPLYGWHKRTIRLFAIPSEEQPSKPETDKLELDWDNMIFIDCVEVPPTHPYFHSDAEVHTWPNWYTYRRTGTQNGDRFGYQFEIPQKDIDMGRPYLVVVDYPALEDPNDSDPARTMEIDILEAPESKYGPVIQTGVFTGNEYPCDWPNENILKQHRIIFRPQTTKNLITIVNRWDDHRAAALRIWIFPIKGDEAHGWFPKTNVITPPDGGRLLGLWWEEPQIYKNFGAPNQTITGFYEALKHMIDYLHYTGQNHLIYPIYFYNDPIYPSRIEGWPVWGEKGGWHPDPWFELMLKMCEANNISVVASFAIKTIPSLERDDSYCEIVEYPYDGFGEEGNGTKLEHRSLLMVREVLEEYGDYPALTGLYFRVFGSDNPEDIINIRLKKVCDKHMDWLLWKYYPGGTVTGQLGAFPPPPGINRKLTFLGWMPHPWVTNENNKWNLDYLITQGFTEAVVKQMYDTAGVRIDAQVEGEPNIIFQRGLRFSAYRRSESKYQLIRDFFTKPEYYDSCYGFFNKPDNTAAIIYNGYFEWGGPTHSFPPATCICMGIDSDFKSELEYGFWRFAAITPGHRYFMEYYMLAMTNLDPVQIGIGGSSVGTVGHDVRLEDLQTVADPIEIYGLPIQNFAKAYRALPAKSFTPVQVMPGAGLCVVRHWGRYFYIMNKKSYDIKARFNFDPETAVSIPITDLSTGESVGWGQGREVQLRPYELKSFRFDAPGYSVKLVSAYEGKQIRDHATIAAAYNFDEGKDNIGATGLNNVRIYDVSAHANDGIAKSTGSFEWTDGIVGSAINFNGDDLVEVPDSTSLKMLDAITVEAWVKNDNINDPWSRIVTKGKHFTNQNYGWMLDFQDVSGGKTAVNFYVEIDGTQDSSGNSGYIIEQSEWYHVAGTFDGNYIKIYVNGELKNSKYHPGTITETGGPFNVLIGKSYGWEEFLTGAIDEVRIYNRVLSAQEIKDHATIAAAYDFLEI
jgi:hypothetical protein